MSLFSKSGRSNLKLILWLISRGLCKVCEKSIFCSKKNIAAHKRVGCEITEEEKKFWKNTEKEYKVESVPITAEKVSNYQEVETFKLSDYLKDMDHVTR